MQGCACEQKNNQEHILPSANITSYEDWTNLEAGGSAGSSNTLACGTASDEMISSDDENIYGRPSKRCHTGREIRPELREHGEQEVVGAAAGGSAIHSTTVPRPQPEEPLEESITENEEEPEYSNYGALAENDMDEIQE